MQQYTIKGGDTLGAIAKRFYGRSNQYPLIAKANNIADPSKIRVGQVLTIPDIPEQPPLAAAENVSGNIQDVILTPGETTTKSSVNPAIALTAAQFSEILGSTDDTIVSRYLSPLNKGFTQFDINTPLRVAHFMAQVCHESGNFKSVVENLNFSAKALMAVFSKYFNSSAMAEAYARQPEKIANLVYANRMGNGDTDSGDGWHYRGRGLIQLTGKDNYASFSRAYDVDGVGQPELVASDPYLSVASACWFWQTRKINQLADNDDIKGVTLKINGGTHGLADRTKKLARAKSALGIG